SSAICSVLRCVFRVWAITRVPGSLRPLLNSPWRILFTKPIEICSQTGLVEDFSNGIADKTAKTSWYTYNLLLVHCYVPLKVEFDTMESNDTKLARKRPTRFVAGDILKSTPWMEPIDFSKYGVHFFAVATIAFG